MGNLRIAVLGAGLMGRAAVYDLARTASVSTVGVFDRDLALAQSVASEFGGGKATAGVIDASDISGVTAILRDYDSAVAAIDYRYNKHLTTAAIAAKCHLVDLGGNNDMVNAQRTLSDQAEAAGVIVIPDCGLAPGMVAVLVAGAVADFDRVERVAIRVGGLPQNPQPPLNYMMVFSAEGLINEYWEPCVKLENGTKVIVDPMTEIETLEFNGVGTVEAFTTSGGSSTLPDTYSGQITHLDYKTIRYPGHCARFRPMLELGLASREMLTVDGQDVEPRNVFRHLLNRELTFDDLDMVLVRVTVKGVRSGSDARRVYEIIDRQPDRDSLTAMMRTTAWPATINALMAADGRVVARGVKPQELVIDPPQFIAELQQRGIPLTISDA